MSIRAGLLAELGAGVGAASRAVPAQVAGLSGVTAIGTAGMRAFAVLG